MTTTVEKSIMVNVPVSVAYNQWTQFEEFPHFMGGVKKITQLSEGSLHWVAEIAGVRREWEAQILEQVPDRKVSWAATQGATNAGAVTFEDVGGGQTSVHLSLEYEPEGLVEKVGDKLNVVENQAERDLDRFKAFIEDEGYATGAWRGTIGTGTTGTPGVEDAAASRGDSGHAGISGKAAAVGLGAAAAATAAVLAGKKGGSETTEVSDVEYVPPTPPVVPSADVDAAVVYPPVDEDATVTPTAPAGSGLEGDPLVVRDDGDDGPRV
jgi:hypothetical protein